MMTHQIDNALKQRLIRIAAIGRQLADDELDQETLEELGFELCELSGVCKVCGGDGIHPGEDPDYLVGETPLARCPSCLGDGMEKAASEVGSY